MFYMVLIAFLCV